MDSLLCFNCNQENDDMLVLGCKHALCLLCTAQILTRDESAYHYKFINCDICNELTNIEESTLKEIFNYSLAHKNQNLHQTNQTTKGQNFQINEALHNTNYSQAQNKDQTLNLSRQQDYSINQSHHIPIFRSDSRSGLLNSEKLLSATNLRLFCNKHNEEVTYFCFDCFSRCICSECVVHGEHKNHDVLNIKKAYPLIIERANEYIGELSGRISDIGYIHKSLESKKKEISSATEGLKNEMRCAFQEIRQRLDKKEKELLSKADTFKEEQMQEISTFSRVIQGKLVSLNKMIDQINSSLMRKDEPTFINYFSETKDKIKSYLEDDYQNLLELSALHSVKVNINSDTLNSMIANLNSIHLEISNMKGFEVTKNQVKNYLSLSKGLIDEVGKDKDYSSLNDRRYVKLNENYSQYNNTQNYASFHNSNTQPQSPYLYALNKENQY